MPEKSSDAPKPLGSLESWVLTSPVTAVVRKDAGGTVHGRIVVDADGRLRFEQN